MISYESINKRLGYNFLKRIEEENKELEKKDKMWIIDDDLYFRSKLHDLTQEEKDFVYNDLIKKEMKRLEQEKKANNKAH